MITGLYHGSGNRFDKFNLNRFSKDCYIGKAIYLTDNEHTAKLYTGRDFDRAFSGRYRDKYSTVYKCNLNSDNIVDYKNDIVCFDYCPKRRINRQALNKIIYSDSYDSDVASTILDKLEQGSTLERIFIGSYICRNTIGKIAKFLGYDCITINAAETWPPLFPEAETHYMVLNSKTVEIIESMPIYLTANR